MPHRLVCHQHRHHRCRHPFRCQRLSSLGKWFGDADDVPNNDEMATFASALCEIDMGPTGSSTLSWSSSSSFSPWNEADTVLRRLARKYSCRDHRLNDHGDNGEKALTSQRLLKSPSQASSSGFPIRISFTNHPVLLLEEAFESQSSFDRKQPTWHRLVAFLRTIRDRPSRYLQDSLFSLHNNNDNGANEQAPREPTPTQVLNSYTFLGTIDRLDESLVVLRRLLDLSWHDILYLPPNDLFVMHPNNSSLCVYRPLPVVGTRRRRTLVETEVKEQWKNDMDLWVLANRTLDATIFQVFGARSIAQDLDYFQDLQDLAFAKCLSNTTIHACDLNGNPNTAFNDACEGAMDPLCDDPCLESVDLQSVHEKRSRQKV